MSTFGRDQDQLAARRRDYTRLNAEKAIKLQDAVRFVISVLEDRTLRSVTARDLALDALRLIEVEVEADFDAVSPLAWSRIHICLLALGEAIAAGLPAKAMRLLFCELADALEAYREQYWRSPPVPWRLCAGEAGKP